MSKDYFVQDMGKYVVALGGRSIEEVLRLLDEEKKFTTFPNRAKALGIMGIALTASASDLEATFLYNLDLHKIHYVGISYGDQTRLRQIELQTTLPVAHVLALSKIFPKPRRLR